MTATDFIKEFGNICALKESPYIRQLPSLPQRQGLRRFAIEDYARRRITQPMR